jgi:uncharacterized protein
MRKVAFTIISLVLFQGSFGVYAQTENNLAEVIAWRAEKDSVFSNPETSPLLPEHVAHFSGLNYFPFNADFLVLARFEAAEGEPFAMPTTTARTPMYRVFGYLHFLLSGTEYILPVYQNLELKNRPGYEDYLFLPFTDLTNAEETYGGGRYIDMRISTESHWEIDFNKSYNPYCAYNSKYSCPIPPMENHLNLRVEAGVLKYDKDY